jgi:hypothetical protein
MKQTDRPSNDQKCADDRCGHPFGRHYVTHAGADGCAGDVEHQIDGTTPCGCTGFLISYKYPAD